MLSAFGSCFVSREEAYPKSHDDGDELFYSPREDNQEEHPILKRLNTVIGEDGSADWMNIILEGFWPTICEYVDNVIRKTAEPAMQKALPSIFSGLHFETIDLGSRPIHIDRVHALQRSLVTAQGNVLELQLGMDIAWQGDVKISLALPQPTSISFGVSSMEILGKLVVNLSGLVPRSPFITAFSLFFPNEPTMKVTWSGLADVLESMNLQYLLQNILRKQVCNRLVLPQRVAKRIIHDVDYDIFSVKAPRPEGKLKVQVVEARRLKAADTTWIGLQGKSDPFVTLSLGSQSFQTGTKYKTLNPKWKNQVVHFLVDIKPHQELRVEVFDEDTLSSHDFLGRCVIPLSTIKQGLNDWWLDLEDDDGTCRQQQSQIRLQMQWSSLILDVDPCRSIPWHPTDITSLLFVGIYRAVGLPSEDQDEKFCCTVAVDQAVQTTKKKLAAHYTPEERPVGNKAFKLHQAGVDNQLIAEVLGVSEQYVEECLKNRGVQCDMIKRRISTVDVHDSRIRVIWEEGFQFMLFNPRRATVSLRIMAHDNAGSCRQVATLQKEFLVRRLLDEKQPTLKTYLPLATEPRGEAKVHVRLQLRVFQ